MSNKPTITCPNCQKDINIEEALHSRFKLEFNENMKKHNEKCKIDNEVLLSKKRELERKEANYKARLEDDIKTHLKLETTKLKDKITQDVIKEQGEAKTLLEKELEQKAKQIQDLNKATLELEQEKRKNIELIQAKEREFDTRLNDALLQSKAAIEKEVKDNLTKENNTRISELENLLKTKSEQVQELETTKAKITKLEMEKQEIISKTKLEYEVKLTQEIQKNKEFTEKELKETFLKKQEQTVQIFKEELEKKSLQLQELESSKIEIAKLKMEKDEIARKVKTESEVLFYEKLAKEKTQIQNEMEEKNSLKLKEKEEQLEQIKRKLEDTQRQVEQGSMQIQGESQEVAIENWLTTQFSFDTIEEVPKGGFGADTIQIVNTREIQNCGKICYESKNTKQWSNDWITKLKQDMLRVNADIGVLVTQAMPNGMKSMGFVDGIWVCSFNEFKGSTFLLRESLIMVQKSISTQENKTDKMSILYGYLTSNEFSMQLKSIAEGFMLIQEELDKQKRSTMASWKRQQKHIDTVIVNTTEMYGSIKGIAGNAIENVKALELEYEEE